MRITRRDFLKYCGVSAAALGLSGTEMLNLKEVLASDSAPTVLWLQGASCTGCSVSLLNRISTTEPTDVGDLLLNHINLAYHPNLMALAGDSAVALAEAAYGKGGYYLAVEGGVPTAFGGCTCWAWTYNNQDVTFQQAVTDLATNAKAILAVGTCAAFGGIPAAGPNPTGVKGVKAATGTTKPVINLAGCPPHPDWVFGTLAQVLANPNVLPTLDSSGRPTSIYGNTVHSACPRLNTDPAITYGVDNACLMMMGCQGPITHANCPSQLWNNKQNWCIDGNARCLGCTEPGYPGTQLFPYVGGAFGAHDQSFIQQHVGQCQQCHNGNTINGGGGGAAPPNPHGYTVNNCASCHGNNIPPYNPGGGPAPPNPHGYTTNNCASCHGNNIPSGGD